jgi:Holliday junction resolvase RusA-like endonuclease
VSELPTIVVPWEHCQHDNHRLMPARPRRGTHVIRLITSPEYRLAKQAAEFHIKRQWPKALILNGAITLSAKCFFPDNRKRDAGNYRKLLTDAMSGICYDDDAQLESETWAKAGIDRKAPRIELTISELDAEIPEPRPLSCVKPTPIEPIEMSDLMQPLGKTLRKAKNYR